MIIFVFHFSKNGMGLNAYVSKFFDSYVCGHSDVGVLFRIFGFKLKFIGDRDIRLFDSGFGCNILPECSLEDSALYVDNQLALSCNNGINRVVCGLVFPVGKYLIFRLRVIDFALSYAIAWLVIGYPSLEFCGTISRSFVVNAVSKSGSSSILMSGILDGIS